MHCIGVKEGNNKKRKKKAKIKISILIFLYTIYFATLNLYTKFEDPGSNLSCEIFVREKEKKTNKGTD